jgi:integrase
LDGLIANPTIGIDRLHEGISGHEPWPDEVIEAYLKIAPSLEHLAFLLALYTGQRRSDVAAMKWTRFDGRFIQVIQQKTNEYLSIPCHKILRKVLLAIMPANKQDYILTTRLGDRFTDEGLSNAFRRLLKKVGAKGYLIHGLRKNAAAKLAEVGCTESEIMAVTGHRTTAMVTKYTKRANQKRRAIAAIEKWERAEGEGPTAREVPTLRTKRA